MPKVIADITMSARRGPSRVGIAIFRACLTASGPGMRPFSRRQFESQHPDPFRAVSRDTLIEAAARVDAVGASDRSALMVELMRLLALLGPRNGHSAIYPDGHPATRCAYPLGFYEFEDGIFVVAAERDDLVGAELIAVEGTAVDDVLDAVTPAIAHDNEWTIRARRPGFVVNASVLRGLGLVEGDPRATFRLRSRNRPVADITLEAIATGDQRVRLGGITSGAKSQAPAYLRRRGEFHWVELAASGRAVHVGYNVTRGPIEEFARELEALAAPARIGVVILDLRQNGGGDNRTYGPLLTALERLGDDKRLAVLTSRVTFSAAMQLVVDLERSTSAVFVGEPTGGSPNQYGDATATELPNSGLNAYIATTAWMTAGEADQRLTREPDIAVVSESRAFFDGDDSTLDTAVAALS